MIALSDSNSIRIIKLLPIILVVVFMLVAIPTAVYQSNYRLNQLEQSIHQAHLQQQKEQMKYQVNSAMNQIEYEYELLRDQLKQQLKSRIDEAHAIATSIYKNNPDISTEELKRRVSSALRPIRFNDGRGYYFIYQMDGVSVMHPLQPQIEGQQMMSRVDARGTPILKEHINLIQQSSDGGAFYRWWFQKPGLDGEYEKFGYGRVFKPLNWFIGTGEYLEDINNDIRERLLLWLSNYQFDDNGYVFVLSDSGDILAHLDNQLIGTSVASLSEATRRLEINTASFRGEYIHYSFNNPEQHYQLQEKIGFVRRMSHWNWWVGAGFFESELVDKIERDLNAAKEQHYRLLVQLFMLFCLTGLVAIWPCMLLSNSIQKRVSRYQARIVEDLQLLTKHKDQLKHQAEHDALTELSNRTRIRQEVDEAIAAARHHGSGAALIYLDVDNFKRINDSYGHHLGDQLLQRMAKLLEQQLGDLGIAGRFGGDEFLVCIRQVDRTQLPALVNRICKAASKTQLINGHRIKSGFTAGVALFPDDGLTSEDLLSKADLLLLDAKKHHRGQARFLDEALSAEISEQLMLEHEMQRALPENQIRIYFQPQISSASGEVTAVEALCRWHNPRLGFVPPDKFIAIAEKTGDIHALGDYVLRSACQQLHQLNQQRSTPLRLSVNISPMQLLQDHFVERTAAIVSDTGLPLHLLTLELTENVLIDDLDKVGNILQQLKDIEFHISLDDFGTGFSSLRYINSLPIDEIKIDRAFVDEMLHNPHSMNVTKTIIAMGKFNEMLVVAEGVETAEQQLVLTEMGCQLLQGYRFSKPLPMSDLKRYLTKAEVPS